MSVSATRKATVANIFAGAGGITASSSSTLTNKSISLGSNTLTATSAQLATAVTDETGSGSLVFATSPTLTTPNVTGLTTITQASDAGSLTINSSATTQYALQVNAVNTDRGVRFYNNGIHNGVNAPFFNVIQDNASSTNNLALIQNDGSGTGLLIDQNGNGIALNIDNAGTSTCISISGSGTGLGVDLNNKSIANIKVAEFNGEVDNGNSSTADTIDWGTGNFQKSTLTGNCTYTFTAPSGPARLTLKILTGAGSFAVTWPATVKWTAATAPTITTTASKVDLVTFWYDGTSYWGTYTQNYTA